MSLKADWGTQQDLVLTATQQNTVSESCLSMELNGINRIHVV